MISQSAAHAATAASAGRPATFAAICRHRSHSKSLAKISADRSFARTRRRRSSGVAHDNHQLSRCRRRAERASTSLVGARSRKLLTLNRFVCSHLRPRRLAVYARGVKYTLANRTHKLLIDSVRLPPVRGRARARIHTCVFGPPQGDVLMSCMHLQQRRCQQQQSGELTSRAHSSSIQLFVLSMSAAAAAAAVAHRQIESWPTDAIVRAR